MAQYNERFTQRGTEQGMFLRDGGLNTRSTAPLACCLMTIDNGAPTTINTLYQRETAKVGRHRPRHFVASRDRMPLTRFFAIFSAVVLTYLLASAPSSAAETNVDLPELGDSASSLFSSQQEYNLGRAWLKAFRSQIRTDPDPLLQDYLEDLVYKIAAHSQVRDRRLQVVVVDNRAINAFAVPGGVVGVHNGALLVANTEAELASVLSHELAHLSQRHFARGVEQQQRASIPTMAALLGSLVLAATAGGDAGIAAMTATQAAALQNQLTFSRENEQEADRVGMSTLVDTGYDPNAFGTMFDNMQASMRYSSGRNIPEFLLTHPLTESRISDARNRAREYPRNVYVDSLDYQLMRARVEVHFADNPAEAIKRFKARLRSGSRSPEADHYGLAIAYLAQGDPVNARDNLASLLAKDPRRIAYVIADAQIDVAGGQLEQAAQKLQKQLAIVPDNHALTMAYADTLLKSNQPQRAEALLTEHSKTHSEDPSVWYLLAETHGLAGNIVGVHQARAEYFVLTGVLDKAQQQLKYALPLVKNDNLTTAKIEARIRQVEDLKTAMKKL
jgi:predicted Zn-dependent protease